MSKKLPFWHSAFSQKIILATFQFRKKSFWITESINDIYIYQIYTISILTKDKLWALITQMTYKLLRLWRVTCSLIMRGTFTRKDVVITWRPINMKRAEWIIMSYNDDKLSKWGNAVNLIEREGMTIINLWISKR